MKTLLISALTTVITLSSSISFANSDDNKYPATNFQPKIVYQDKEVLNEPNTRKQVGEKSAYDPKYPANSFQPKVIYQDKEAIKTTSADNYMGEKSSFDPKYPAANFEPKVIYP